MLKRFLLILTLLLTTVSSYPIIQNEEDFVAVREKYAITYDICSKHIKNNGIDKATEAYAKDLEILIDDIINYIISKEKNLEDNLGAKKFLSARYSARADICRVQGKYHEGLMDCGRALRLDKDNGHAYLIKAHIWIDLGDEIKGDRSMRIAAEKGINEAKEYILAYS